jgi:chromosomal replication initiation ATPase DnaA
MKLPKHPDAVPAARRLACSDYRAVLAAVAKHYGIAVDSFLQQRSGAVSRDLAARLARELTPVTLRELAAAFGLTHPGSVRNLIRRADRALKGSRALRDEIEAIRHRLPKTGNRP